MEEDMRLLPKKTIFALSVFLSLIISSFLLPKVVLAEEGDKEPLENWPTLENFVSEQKMRTEAAADGDTVVTRAATEGLGLGTAALAGADAIVPLCVIQTIKENNGALNEEKLEKCPKRNTAMGNISYAMGLLYAHPPASGIAYTYDLLVNAGLLAKPAYAQGIGFAGLSSFLPFWKTTRNIAYSVLIIVMITVGFMIIFRMKIDPKTVISIQAALPKIVLTLILITFSYPIVGFLVDLMYLVMAISISVMIAGIGGTVGGADAASLQAVYMTAGPGDLLEGVFWPYGPLVISFAKYLVGAVVGSGIIVGMMGALPVALPIVGTLASSAILAGIVGGLLVGALLLFILALGFLFTFIRLLFLLLNSYIQIIINLLLGPLILLGEAVPGRSAFKNWLMNIMANLVVFPATALIIMFAVYLASTKQEGSTWSPPFLGFLGGGDVFHSLLALGVIFMAPSLVAQIKKAFHPKPAMPVTAGTAFAPLTGGIQTTMGAASQFYYLQHMPGISRLFGGKHKPGTATAE